MKTAIIPAILPKDWSELEEKISLVKELVKTVQIDICDGQFTPDPSWPYKRRDGSFEKIIKEENGLPGWDVLNFEIDLMVNKPEEKVDDWVAAGASRIILHAESKGNVGQAIQMLKDRVEIGLALNIETPISEVGNPRFAIGKGSIQFIQLMGIDNIGFQGQAFDIKVFEKIKEVKKMCPDFLVSIDGGVSLENAKQLIEAGADRLVVGSAIFEADNYIEAIADFRKILS